jgi:3-oxoacyl-[acyl-carrier-protein] synthase III
MYRSIVAGMGHYVPETVVKNSDLQKFMDTSDEWIVERTGIQERRYGKKHEETTTTMGARAAEMALKDAGLDKNEVDFIIFATLSPDYYFPGCGVLMQREMGMTQKEVGALDIRNQCSGFVYALSVADQFIKTGMYQNILVVGSEMHSMGLDFTTRGRNVTVIFGDGAGAAVLQRAENTDRGVLASRMHADGTFAEELAFLNPGSHGGYHQGKEKYGYPDSEFGGIFLTKKMWEDQDIFPQMNGPFVFKLAVQKFPEVILEVLEAGGHSLGELNLLIPHQANLRIAQFVQKKLQLSDEQVYNNIQKYGNTTAASIPIALSEAHHLGKIKRGDLVCLAAFGSGFTWGANLIRW